MEGVVEIEEHDLPRPPELGDVVQEIALHDGDVAPSFELCKTRPVGRLDREERRRHVAQLGRRGQHDLGLERPAPRAMCQARMAGPAIFAVSTSSVMTTTRGRAPPPGTPAVSEEPTIIAPMYGRSPRAEPLLAMDRA